MILLIVKCTRWLILFAQTKQKNIGGRDIQVMLDALCSKKGVLGTRKEDYSVQDVPLYWSNVGFFFSLKIECSINTLLYRMIL